MGKRRQDTNSFKIRFSFRNDSQKHCWQLLEHHRVSFLTGPAGTAKTFIATAFAAKHAIEYGTFEKVLVMRPTVEAAGESIGFLPGSLDAKVKPFLDPVYTMVDKLADGNTALRSAILSKMEVKAMGYLRGCTFENSIVIVDEAQNVRMSQMTLILSRLGVGSNIVFCGDTRQSDIDNSPLHHCACRLDQIPEVGHYQFTAKDNVRDPLVNSMLDVLASDPELSARDRCSRR
jgi:phosphate starvation-inducible PhoH-like protein